MIFRFHSPDYTSRTAAQLIEACTGGDAGAWQEFLRRYHNLVALTASRAARRWGDSVAIESQAPKGTKTCRA